MFRNALRQSSRSVAAVSAPGRVAVSSVLLSHSLTTPPLPPVPIDIPDFSHLDCELDCFFDHIQSLRPYIKNGSTYVCVLELVINKFFPSL